MEIGIQHLHSFVRWLVVLSTLVALVWMIRGIATNQVYDEMSRRIMTIFSSLVGTQWLIGILLIGYYGFAYGQWSVPYRWEHATTMTLALVGAHGHMMLKKRDDRTRFIGGLISILLVLALIYLGVSRLPYGWRLAPAMPS